MIAPNTQKPVGQIRDGARVQRWFRPIAEGFKIGYQSSSRFIKVPRKPQEPVDLLTGNPSKQHSPLELCRFCRARIAFPPHFNAVLTSCPNCSYPLFVAIHTRVRVLSSIGVGLGISFRRIGIPTLMFVALIILAVAVFRAESLTKIPAEVILRFLVRLPLVFGLGLVAGQFVYRKLKSRINPSAAISIALVSAFVIGGSVNALIVALKR